MDFEKIKSICKKCNAFCCKINGTVFTESEKRKIKDLGLVKEGKSYWTKGDLCPYLKGDKCSIQSCKPTICKIWPVSARIVKGKRKYVLINCPLAKHLSKDDISCLISLAEKLPDETFKLEWSMSTKHRKLINKFKLMPINI